MALSSQGGKSERTEEISEEEEQDDALDEDIEALRRACMIIGINPDEINDSTAENINTTTTTASGSDGKSDDDEEDDLQLVRNIQQRFSIPSDTNQPLFLKPLSSLPPIVEDDDEDDFETLRAIERRFSKYDNAVKNTVNHLNKTEPACVTGISLEQETPSVLYAERNNVGEPSNFVEWHQSEATGSSALPLKYSAFPNPEAAEVFVNAIKKNRSCQKFIRSKLIQIEARIEENKILKERVKVLKGFQVACRKRASRALSQRKDARLQLISVRKSRNSQNTKVIHKKAPALFFGPVENSHVANYRMVLERFPLSLSRQRWSPTDKENLWKGIKQQFQEMLLQKSVEVCSADSNVLDDIIASISDFEITPVIIRSFLPKVDWERLASTYVVGRSGAECEQRWLNIEDPLINHNPWTADEDSRLLHILQKGGIYNWINISITLGKNRTPYRCLARYQRSLNHNVMNGDWTKDDDAQLRAAVEEFGENDWQRVASNLKGKTGTQCSNRWLKTLNPARKRVGRWTLEEDKRLKVAVVLFGPKTWQKIAQFVPGRTQVQCRERWVNCLDPSLNLEEWTKEEDSKLKAAISEYGHCWSKVAASVPPRTDSQCRRRWKVLLPHEVPLVQAARKIQKAALISNFVDREAERPALDSTHFLPVPGTEPENGKNIVNQKKPRGRTKSKKTKDVASCDSAPKRKRAPCRRLKKNQRTNPAPGNQDIPPCPDDSTILRITNGDNNTENCGEDGTILVKKKTVPNKRLKRNRCTNPVPGNQDIPLFREDPTILRITNGDENIENCDADDTVTKRKKEAPKKHLKRNQCTHPVPGNQNDLLLLEDPAILKEMDGGDNIQNCGEDATVLGKKKKAPSRHLKRNKTVSGNQDLPLLPEDSTILRVSGGDDDIEGCCQVDTSSRKRKRAPNKGNHCPKQAPGNQSLPPDNSSSLEVTHSFDIQISRGVDAPSSELDQPVEDQQDLSLRPDIST